MHQIPYLSDRAWVRDAVDLIVRFGAEAPHEAAVRAGRSRDLGNVVHYCRWRQIERLIRLLGAKRSAEMVH